MQKMRHKFEEAIKLNNKRSDKNINKIHLTKYTVWALQFVF